MTLPENEDIRSRLRVMRVDTMQAALAELEAMAPAYGLTIRPDARATHQRRGPAWSILFRLGQLTVATWWPATGKLRVGLVQAITETPAETLAMAVRLLDLKPSAPSAPKVKMTRSSRKTGLNRRQKRAADWRGRSGTSRHNGQVVLPHQLRRNQRPVKAPPAKGDMAASDVTQVCALGELAENDGREVRALFAAIKENILATKRVKPRCMGGPKRGRAPGVGNGLG